jgi:hypothetical protein
MNFIHCFKCSLTHSPIRDKSSLLNEVMMVLITWSFFYEIWQSQLPSNNHIFASIVYSHGKWNAIDVMGCVPKGVKLGCEWAVGGGCWGGRSMGFETWTQNLACFDYQVLGPCAHCGNLRWATLAWTTHLRCVIQITLGH